MSRTFTNQNLDKMGIKLIPMSGVMEDCVCEMEMKSKGEGKRRTSRRERSRFFQVGLSAIAQDAGGLAYAADPNNKKSTKQKIKAAVQADGEENCKFIMTLLGMIILQLIAKIIVEWIWKKFNQDRLRAVLEK